MAELVGQSPEEGSGFAPLSIPEEPLGPTGATEGPCDWPIDVSDCEQLATNPKAQAIVDAAIAYLWNWTGRRFGLCEVTVRPCRLGCREGASRYYPPEGPGWSPVLVGGVWRNITCGVCRHGCECEQVERVQLPGPVYDIVGIRVDGAVLDPAAYRVDNHTMLVRDDGGTWPACQALHLPDGDPGTWSVTYRWGWPVPVGGQLAAAVLACELAKAVAGDESCGLPQRVQTITREGVTIGLLDPFDGLENGKTGLWAVDSWIESLRKPAGRARVYSPDRGFRTVSTTYRGGV
jgi:hypothetical protein